MIFDKLYEMMKMTDKTSLDKSLDNVHADGVFSLVVGGTENGSLTRIFIATKKLKPFDVQFHSHRYALTIGVIKGQFTHHIAQYSHSPCLDVDSVGLAKFKYQSPLNGGNGLTKDGYGMFKVNSYQVPVGGELFLRAEDIHSVSVSKGTMWVVQEHGFESDHSVVLGTDFVTDGLYTKPLQYQVNDMFQKVYKEVSKLV